MYSESSEKQQIEKILIYFLEAIQNKIKGNYPKISKKIFVENEKLNSEIISTISPFQRSTCRYLKKALNKIPNSLTPMNTFSRSIAYNVVWHEAKRGVPDLFKGGYAFAEIIGKMGLKFSDTIRIGFFLQKPNTNYPLHAHDAEELYFILSGTADWQIEDKKFEVSPGTIIHHETCEKHATITSKLPLFALWIWTGKINGRYWFANHPEIDCPL